jgi:hypothetical protein
MAADCEGPVVAVDVMRPFAVPDGAPAERPLPGIVDTIGRSMVLASWQRAEAGRALARAVIAPGLADVGMFDFARLREIVEIGRTAARLALPDLRDLLDGGANGVPRGDDPMGAAAVAGGATTDEWHPA